jgi:hypothetical protein
VAWSPGILALTLFLTVFRYFLSLDFTVATDIATGIWDHFNVKIIWKSQKVSIMYHKWNRFLKNKYYNSGLCARKLKLCLKFIKGRQIPFSFMNVMLLYSDHQYVEATCVVSTGTQICILELITLKMTTWVVETGWWSL